MKTFLLSCFLMLPLLLFAQENQQKTFNPIQVASPILSVAPDARASGMGDMGVATEPDANSQHWNAAKYAFIKDEMGVSLSYMPWLRGLVNDVNISYLSLYYRLKGQQAIATSLRYFSLGNMSIVNGEGEFITDALPYEMAWDVSFSLPFSENFSAALTGRYIRSDLTGGVTGINTDGGDYNSMSPANAFGFDVGLYYQHVYSRDEEYAIGLSISNIGTKVAYSDNTNKHFLPATFRVGARYTFPIDFDNKLTFGVELSKLLVPSPAVRDTTGKVIKGKEDDVSKVTVVQAMLQSFYDAPYGIGEEMSETMLGFGGEYAYRNQVFARAGYFHDSKRKGNRRYLTFGGGFRYSFVTLDLAYYFTFTAIDPLANTVKVSLGFYF